MDTGLLAQYVIIGLAVVLSAAFVMHKQFPSGVRRARIACALPLVRENRSAWLRRLGQWMAPAPRGGEGACGGCSGCDTNKSG